MKLLLFAAQIGRRWSPWLSLMLGVEKNRTEVKTVLHYLHEMTSVRGFKVREEKKYSNTILSYSERRWFCRRGNKSVWGNRGSAPPILDIDATSIALSFSLKPWHSPSLLHASEKRVCTKCDGGRLRVFPKYIFLITCPNLWDWQMWYQYG